MPADPAVSAKAYELDVRAYCILSHAAFEQFFEEVANNVMNQSVDGWLSPERKINDSLLTLAAYSDQRLKYPNKDSSDKPFEYLRETITVAKQTLSRKIRMENHGISVEQLANILLPVALNIHSDENLRNSLSQLVKQRGSYAHHGRISEILAPEDAKKYVADCLIICREMSDKAKTKFA